MPVTKDEFRAAMSRFASGVSVVTTKKDDGKLEGITVSAFSSLSLDPPLVLICIDKRASIHDSLSEGRHFAVNILAEDQEIFSRRFASRDTDRFGGVGYNEGPAGSPLLNGALCHVECRIVHTYPGGDHTLVVGEVETTIAAEGKPLVYFRGGYARLA
ncbi:MAG TPA: flavin reductase family protein [Blastocatellia bacterium]|jgi:flavin reductase (DIM6/NTAB) family NADH-FMN oxidoreductase RutF